MIGERCSSCMLLQVAMVRELFTLAQKATQQYAAEAEQRQGRRGIRKAKLLYSQQWYFFGVAAFWMYFRLILLPSLGSKNHALVM